VNAFKQHARVLHSVCHVYVGILKAGAQACLPFVLDLCAASRCMFEATLVPACFDVFSEAVALFASPTQHNSVQADFVSTALVVLRVTIDTVTKSSSSNSNNKDGGEHAAMLTGYFRFCRGTFEYCADVLSSSKHLEQIAVQSMALAAHALHHVQGDRACLRAVCDFVSALCTCDSPSQQLQAAINHALKQRGAELVLRLVFVVASTHMRDRMSLLGHVLYVIMERTERTGQQWIAAALQHAAFPAPHVPALCRERFVHCAWLLRKASQYGHLIRDFASFCAADTDAARSTAVFAEYMQLAAKQQQ
jgi:hypothetical protein